MTAGGCRGVCPPPRPFPALQSPGVFSGCANGNLLPLFLFQSNLIPCQLRVLSCPLLSGKGSAESHRRGSQGGSGAHAERRRRRDSDALCRCHRPHRGPLPTVHAALSHLQAPAAVPLCSKCRGREKNQFPSAEQCPLIYRQQRKKFFISFSGKGLLCCLLFGSDAVTAPFLPALVFC